VSDERKFKPGDTVEPSYEGMDALQLMVELGRNIQAVSIGKLTLDEANRRTRRINTVLEGSHTTAELMEGEKA
jgi:hypothetical protein